MSTNTITLSPAQVEVLSTLLAETDKLRIVVKNTNLDGAVAVRIDGKTYIVGVNGDTFDLS